VPLPGVFNWYYLQCVIHTFGTPQYKNLPGISSPVHPFKTADNESDEIYTDNDETELPYPSYRLDRFLGEQGKRQTVLNGIKR